MGFFAGAIFEQGTDEVQSAFKYAVMNHNRNSTARKFELQAYVDVINTADAFKLSRLSKCDVSLLIASGISQSESRITLLTTDEKNENWSRQTDTEPERREITINSEFEMQIPHLCNTQS